MIRGRWRNSMKKVLPCALAVLAVLAECVYQETFGEEEEKEWIDVTIPITENILQSMNEGDYEGFTRDFSEEMKEAMTLQRFIDVKGERIYSWQIYIKLSCKGT